MTASADMVDVIVDELNELNLPCMAAALDGLYHSERFLEADAATLISEIVDAEYQKKAAKRLVYRLQKAKLSGCPQELSSCTDSKEREYMPYGITQTLSSLDFIRSGLSVCILGPSDCGKTYFAKALGIDACRCFKVCYHHCETFLEEMVALKQKNFAGYQKKMRRNVNLDLLILDDFLLHTITDEREVKILFELLEKRSELQRSTIVCSQREPKSWASMMMNDEVSSNAIMKRATKHYTVMISPKESN